MSNCNVDTCNSAPPPTMQHLEKSTALLHIGCTICLCRSNPLNINSSKAYMMGLWPYLSLDRIPILIQQVDKICLNYMRALKYENAATCQKFHQEIAIRADELQRFALRHESDQRSVLIKKQCFRLRKVLQHRDRSLKYSRTPLYPESTSSLSYDTSTSSELASSSSQSSGKEVHLLEHPSDDFPSKKQTHRTGGQPKRSRMSKIYAWEEGSTAKSYTGMVSTRKCEEDPAAIQKPEKRQDLVASFRIVLSAEEYYKYLRKLELHRCRQRREKLLVERERKGSSPGLVRGRQDSQFLSIAEPYQQRRESTIREEDKSRWIDRKGFRLRP